MSILADLKMYGRFALGLRGFLRVTPTLEEAKARVRRRLAEREANFLRLVERGMFGYERSPYLPLLNLAQVELGDIQNMVRDRGLEETLLALREAGVYITFEEFKGREPIVRDGRVIPVQPHDFDNPYLSTYYRGQTGGTTGAGTRVSIDLEHLPIQAPNQMLTHQAHDMLDAPVIVWFGSLPDPTGLQCILRTTRFGQVPLKWFTPTTSRDLKQRSSFRNGLATSYTVLMTRLAGAPIPWPEEVSLDEASVVADCVARILGDRRNCIIITHVSKALRVCVAAQEAGLDLTGATFCGGGEPPTPAKVRGITATGARYVPSYFLSEIGAVGFGCARPVDTNDIHFFKDGLALIQYPRQVPGSELTVEAFHFTTLLSTTPKLMLNVESDDYGVVESRQCGCLLGSYGFTEHLRDIRSFRKLTGEGVTLVGSEMVHILEEVLPERFGGSPLDYQLLEEEDEQGFTRLSLLVHPRVGIADEEEVIEAVMESLGRSSISADIARAIWNQAGTLRIQRREPTWTARGKLMPLHIQRFEQLRSSAQEGRGGT